MCIRDKLLTDYTYGTDFITGQTKERDILSNQWLGSSVSATNNGMMVVCVLYLHCCDGGPLTCEQTEWVL